jgi:lysozyme
MGLQNFKDLVNVPDLNDYLKGIDLSHHNEVADWQSILDEQIDIVYIKSSEGVDAPDNKALKHAQTAKDKGLKIGYYHFGRPDMHSGGTVLSDSEAEADSVSSILSGLPEVDLPLVLDLEDTIKWDSPLNPQDYLNWIESFLKKYNKKVILYSRKGYLDEKLPNAHNLNLPVWLSRYTRDYSQAIAPNGWTEWLGWQFTETGIIGSNPPLDLSIWKKEIVNL